MSHPFLTLGREHTNVFYLTLVYLFHLDGEITEREKEILSNFLRMTAATGEDEDDDALARILDFRPPNLLQVVDYLRSLPNDEVRFFYLLQVAALTAYDEISDRQARSLRTMARELQLESFPNYLEDLFLKPNPSNPDLLFIGNDPSQCDIMKCREAMGAVVIRWADFYYFFSNRGEGLVRFNQRILLDFVVQRVDFTDRIEIKGEYLTFADLLFRYELKGDPEERTFHIQSRKSADHTQFLLTPESGPDVLGTVKVKGCHLFLSGPEGHRRIALEGLTESESNSVACLDNRILIDGTYLFDLSQQIKNLILSDAISARLDQKRRLTLGNQKGCDLVMADGLGPWRIALEENPDKEWVMELSEMGYPLLVSGLPAKEGQILRSGDVLALHDRTILFEPEGAGLRLVENKIHHLKVTGLSVRVGVLRRGLHDLHFENRARDFVCIMGPSGCGKTTLVRTLAGYLEPEDPGTLRLNTHSLAAHFEQFKNHIGYVTQEDVLFERLTVRENLDAYARLKAPHLDPAERSRRLDKVLREVGLIEKEHTMVGSPEEKILSGGEKRRLNIAMELVSDADVLFLDEPTSGLSSFDSLKVIQLLSHIAQAGKLIYVVIHQPSPEVFHHFTHLILLDKGGYQAFFGKTGRAFEYFSKYSGGRTLRNPDDLLEVLEAVRRTPDGELLYDEGEGGQPVPMRVKSPRQWAEEFSQRRGEYYAVMDVAGGQEGTLPDPVRYGRAEERVQLQSLFWRNLTNRLRDRFSVIFSILLPSVLALAIGVILRYKPQVGTYQYAQNIHLPKFLFLTAIIFLFLAVANGINEIFRDQLHLRKERLIAYHKSHYLLAKLSALAFTTFYQVMIYALISFAVLGIPIVLIHEGHVYARVFFKFVGFSVVGSLSMTMLTLYLSTFLRSEKSAFLAVPLLIVPQIIFGGMFLKYNELNVLSTLNPRRPVPLLCDTVHARWMFEGYLNIFRYDIPDKLPEFQTESFARRFGTFNNRELVEYFTGYNRAVVVDADLRKQLDEEMETRFRSFVDVMGKVERHEVAPWTMVRHDLHSSINFFPYYRKIFYPFVIPTLSYNTLVLLFLTLIFHLLTLARLKVQHRVQRKNILETLWNLKMFSLN